MSDEARNEVAAITEDDENFSDDSDLLPDEGEEDLDEDQFSETELMSGGASIATPGGSIYWLKLERLAEFNQMDKVIKDDTDFWAWFDGAVNSWGLRPTGQQHKKRGSLTNLWDGGTSTGWSSGAWTGWSSAPKKYLSDWWGGSSWFGGKTAARDRKLAIAVQAVQTTIRVVDNHARRMRVVLSVDENEGEPQSYTSYDEQLIQVSPMALLDDKIEEGDGIDVTTGFGLHEAGHAEYGEATLKALRQPFLLRPVAVSSLMHNVLEDVRTEGLTAMDEESVFPGFRGYLDRARKYMWDLGGPKPTEWGPEVKDKVNAIILAGKWYDEFRPTVTDAALAAEVDWFHDLVEQYHRKDIALRPALVAMMDRLKSDPNTEKQLAKMEAEEKALEKAIGDAEKDEEALKQLVKQALKKFGMDGLSSCSSGSMPGGGVTDPSGKRKSGIGANEAEQINRLVRSEIESATVEDMHLPDLNGANPKITVLHPPETPDSRSEYKPANSSLVAKMRSVFFFRPSAMEDTDRLMRTGSVDEDELWRAGVADYRLFEQKRIESAPDTSVTMLIDASGSMTGYVGEYSSRGSKTKVEMATDLAQVMQAVLKDMNGVKTRVRAHTGDCEDAGGSGGIAIYKIWEHGEPLSRLSLMSTDIDHSDNYDGYAIGWCIKELIDQSTPNEQKVLIVLSDGYPAGQGYQGEPAYRHMRETIAWGEKNGVDTIQIAIQGGMNQADMFKHFVTFETAEKLPSQLTALLRKVFPYR